jgi:hypothetical protein
VPMINRTKVVPRTMKACMEFICGPGVGPRQLPEMLKECQKKCSYLKLRMAIWGMK